MGQLNKKNILFFASDSKWKEDMCQQIDSIDEYFTTKCEDRSDAIELITSSGKRFSACIFEYFEDNCNDVNVIIRYLCGSPYKSILTLFAVAKERSLVDKLIEASHDIEIKFIDASLSVPDIVSSIQKVLTVEKKTSVEAEVLKAFIDSTNVIIDQMVGGGCEIKNNRPTFWEQMSPKPVIGINGKINISSNSFNGSFFISFPTVTFLNIFNAVLCDEQVEINDENSDFAAELANIIHGNASAILSEKQVSLDLQLPEILISSLEDVPTKKLIVIPYDSKFGRFYIRVAIGKDD